MLAAWTCSRIAIPGQRTSLVSARRIDAFLRQLAHDLSARLPQRVRDPVRRLVLSTIPIIQCATAAGLSWWIAKDVVGNPQPFFAPIAAVVSLGLTLATRVRRVFELLAGVSVGIGVGSLLIGVIGTGPWQIAMVVGLAMAVAVLVDGGPVITMQAATSGVLVATLLPPGGDAGLSRVIDALIGGAVGVLVVAILPTHPVRRARRDAGAILAEVVAVLRQVSRGLEEGDASTIDVALRRARATQPGIDQLRSDLKGGRDISRLAPVYWGSRSRLDRLAATADPIDAAVRNTRVLARRALTLVLDGERLDPELVELLRELAAAADVVRQMVLAAPGDKPDEAEAARRLRTVARRARFELVEGRGLSSGVVLAQVRSILVDLFQVSGLKRVSALATLPPTVEHPAVPPEDHED
ncbi:FUSC family protein [Lolliginicoccus suaedae]|uniref:FUSC family protein n=1 Tax=Lolliginicoccus suaedae TaxID=2605429 RepID=UPI0011EC32BE|nr:FUSC family protein [Lolliginicoccus suaedae]